MVNVQMGVFDYYKELKKNELGLSQKLVVLVEVINFLVLLRHVWILDVEDSQVF